MRSASAIASRTSCSAGTRAGFKNTRRIAPPARGQDPLLPPQPSGGPAVVEHGHHGREVRRDFLQAAQQGAEARAAAEDDNPRPSLELALLEDHLHEARIPPREEDVDDGADGL